MSGDLEVAWKTWREEFKLFSTATRLKSKDAEFQAATFLVKIGDNARRVYKIFGFENPDDELCIEKLMELFDKHCDPAVNASYRDSVFGSHNQPEDRRFNDWLTDLHTLATQCDFSELHGHMLQSRIPGIRAGLMHFGALG